MERVSKVKDLAKAKGGLDVSIPIYVMTSIINDKIIKDFFKSKKFFGYPEKDVVFFEQGLEPCLSLDEKLIIDSPTSLAMAPDGNGGIYKALTKTGALANMVKRGLKHVHIYGIDNVLTKSADPVFIGACIERNVQVGNKVVWRASKSEKVGTTVSVGGKMKILEYSEIPQDLAEAEDQDGKLVYGAGNICNHYLSVQFLEELMPKLESFYHIAEKKIPYYDPSMKKVVQPTKNNGIKLEMFIFDVFPMADRFLVAEVSREDEFAPVKNSPGASSDSPDTARKLISDQAHRWLKKAGATVENDKLGFGEISSSVSYSGEGLENFAGKKIEAPYCLNNSVDSTKQKTLPTESKVNCSCTIA